MGGYESYVYGSCAVVLAGLAVMLIRSLKQFTSIKAQLRRDLLRDDHVL
jgi:heme exporter protein CcmD